jgi:glycosyltransferase involved in cell wall biosynthesis
MPALPLVSVIIPTYNRLDLLKEALDSVSRQSYPNKEIVVVDDGSDDDTQAAMRGASVIYHRMPHSGLPGGVRNEGVRRSSGSLLAFLDSDDLWEPGKLEKQALYLLRHPRLSLCHTREIWLRDNKIVSQEGQHHRREGHIFSDALKKCVIGPSTTMMRRELFSQCGTFHPYLTIAEDYELWLRVCANHVVGYIDEPLTVKRGGRKDQLSSRYGPIEKFRIAALYLNIASCYFRGWQLILARSELSLKCRIYAQGCLKRRRIAEGSYYMSLSRHFSR